MSTDGKHRVTVTIEDPAGTDAALAWAKATYAKLVKTDSVDNEKAQDDLHAAPAPECAIHRVAMVRVDGKLGPFWSCHRKNPDGSWCDYRPSLR